MDTDCSREDMDGDEEDRRRMAFAKRLSEGSGVSVRIGAFVWQGR